MLDKGRKVFFILSFRNKHEETRDMLFSQRKYTIINQRTETCNESYFLFEKNEKTLRKKRVSFVILHLTLQSQVSRSIPKPTI